MHVVTAYVLHAGEEDQTAYDINKLKKPVILESTLGVPSSVHNIALGGGVEKCCTCREGIQTNYLLSIDTQAGWLSILHKLFTKGRHRNKLFSNINACK